MLQPGPSDLHPRVMNAMSLPVNSLIHEKRDQILKEIKEGVQYIFQTKYDLTMVMSTLRDGGMEAAIHVIRNLAEPGETVAIAINGMWSETVTQYVSRAADIAESHGINVIRTEKTYGDVFTLDDIKQTLEEHKPVLLYLVLGESSTGTLQPMEGIGELCRTNNCLLVLDCVAAVVVVPVYTDKWGVDVVIGSSNGGLSCPPGLTPIAFSPGAVKRMMSRKSPVSVDDINLGKKWDCLDGEMTFEHDTQPFHLYYALREGLAVVVEEGLENVWKRHRKCQTLLRDGLKELGVDFFVKDENLRFPGVTTICLPGTDLKLVHDYMKRHCTYTEISLGTDSTGGLILKIEILGYNARENIVEHVLKMLKEALESAKEIRT